MKRTEMRVLAAIVVGTSALVPFSATAADVDEIQARSHAADEIRVEADRERQTVESSTRSGARIEVFGGYAGYLGPDMPVNGFAFGGGARVGYVFTSRLFLGGSFTYHAGSSQSVNTCSGCGNGTSYQLSATSYYFGPEIGYEAAIGSFAIRPYAGFGYLATNGSASDPGYDIAYGGTQITFAVVGQYYFSDSVFAGLDARWVFDANFNTGHLGNAPTAMADAGVRF
jgi:hypothetical protein